MGLRSDIFFRMSDGKQEIMQLRLSGTSLMTLLTGTQRQHGKKLRRDNGIEQAFFWALTLWSLNFSKIYFQLA